MVVSTKVLAEGTATFWLDKMGDPELAEKIFGAWQTATGITVEYNNYLDTASYQTAMSQSIDSDAAPDFFTWWSGEM